MRSLLFAAFATAMITCVGQAASSGQAVSPEAQARARQEFAAGLAAVQHGRLDEAIARTSKAASLDPTFGEAQYNLGVLYSQKNDWGSAIRHMKKAVVLQPSSTNARFNLGFFYQQTGKYAQAEKCYRQTLGMDPNAANAHLNLGILLSKRGSPEAFVHCRRAFELNPASDTPSCPR